MTGGSFCSIETKSTEGMMMCNQYNNMGGEEDTISLPDNVRALLVNSKNNAALQVMLSGGKPDQNEAVSSLDNTSRYGNRLGSLPPQQCYDAETPTCLDPTESSFSSPGRLDGSRREKIGKRHKSSKKKKQSASRGSRKEKMLLQEKSDFHEKPMPPTFSYDSECAYKPQPHDDGGGQCLRKPQPHDDGGYYPKKALTSRSSSRLKQPEEELSPVLRKYQYPRVSSRNDLAKEKAQSTSNLYLRMSAQMKSGRRAASLPNPHRRNRIKLHVYDLIPAETVMQLPWGCMLPIGRCFDVVNSSLHSMGTGAYHVGIEVNGVEYSFGACENPGSTGVFSCVPKRAPGYQFRTTIDFGERSLMKLTKPKLGSSSDEEREVDGREIIKQMATEYMGVDYDLLRRNCVTFASDACVRLGIEDKEIPSWFRNLCESGALTHDMALSTVEPISSVFSACEDYGNLAGKTIEDGFEIITSDGQGKGVRVVDTGESLNFAQCTLGARRALSWTY